MKKIFVFAVALATTLSGFAEEKPLKVLMIGNSFSISCLRYLPKVAEASGRRLDLASLYIGGCSLERHCRNIEAAAKKPGFRPYRFDRVVEGRCVVEKGTANIPDALVMDKWDVVTIQQASHFSWDKASYHPWGDTLVAKIRELAPQAKILVQETWSYPPWDKRLKKFGFDQAEMYKRLHVAYHEFAGKYGLDVIPVGTAAERCPDRNSLFTKPDFHFNHGEGEYLQALVWTAKLFDVDVRACGYLPPKLAAARADVLKAAAMSAVTTGSTRATTSFVSAAGKPISIPTDEDWTVHGEGTSEPDSYVPAMLSNGSLCMTADFLGGVPLPSKSLRSHALSPGIFIAGRRLLYKLYGHGRYRLTLSVDGKPLERPDRWSQTLDPFTARSIVTNVFGDVTRVVETFVASGRDVIAIRQTFPGMDDSRISAGIDYLEHRDAEGRIVVGPWEELPDGRAYSFTAYGRHIDKTRITIRNVKEDGAFVTFISYDKQGDKPYGGTYADLAKQHEGAWRTYYSASDVRIPDAKLMRLRAMAEYQLKCNVTRWALPVGLFASHWNGNSFAFDELYGIQGLLSSGHFDEARHVADFRLNTLGQAKKRVGGRGARWYWECMEDTMREGAPSGHWLDHIFHMSAIAQTCNLTAFYTDDLDYLREKMYPVMRECARFYRAQCVFDAADGSSFVRTCTDLERLGAAKERPCMTTCGIIHTFRICAAAADRLGVDAAEAADWRAKADRLEKSLPVKDGRFVPAANALDAVSMGTLAGYFPFTIFSKGHKEQTAAVDFFLAKGVKAGNMYAMGKKICPWYAATMAMAALRAGKYEKVYPLVMTAASSSGHYGEYWEINEPGNVQIKPWFMTAAGTSLYAMNQMLLTEQDGECLIGAGVPKEWKDWSFRLPAEGGYEVECEVKGGKVAKLVLRPRRIDPARKVRLVLPDGSRREVPLDRSEINSDRNFS